jgi:DNA-binding NarL/FixJ family response regulator
MESNFKASLREVENDASQARDCGRVPITVWVVEDDERVRASLAALIQSSESCVCAGVSGTGEEALVALPQQRPNVVLMDINLPRMSGVECVRKLKAILPGVFVIMLTVYEDSEQIFGALEAGASGYLLKRTAPEAILSAIQEVFQGGAPMSSHIARMVVQSFQKRRPSSESKLDLTEREQQVLKYVAKGYINKEIAEALCVSLETVRSHLKNIYEKLHVRSRTEAAMHYLKKSSPVPER